MISIEEAAGKVPVCAAVGGFGAQDVADAASRAEALGANMIAVVPPVYIIEKHDVMQCFKRVANAVRLPMMIHSLFGGSSLQVLDA